ncbi:unnamed protein product [Arabidopsis lyrata]|uniref:Predicted protein n=1 Tax=Arabidopsis lyrata subsp. lyrata TaxID=81972 RepID=D7M2E9_ARALL|nr:predicted protein [Arabidopsis lyrata subsp. lyrata]CAH8272041.1 unnamed protein product [Arabidopsis lyrata]
MEIAFVGGGRFPIQSVLPRVLRTRETSSNPLTMRGVGYGDTIFPIDRLIIID